TTIAYGLAEILVILHPNVGRSDPWQAIFTVDRGEAAAITCPKGTMWPFKSKTKGRQRRPINEAQTFTRPIISGHSITRPSESTDTVTRPSSSTDDTHGTAFSDDVSGLPMYRPASHEGLQEGPSGSSFFYQSPSPYGFQTASSLVMQTPPQSPFYQGGSSSQHRQPDILPEEPESPPEQPQPLSKDGQRRNSARNRRWPPCGTESGEHGD
ncbi:hypothetical protein Gotur_006963, partial [Gossypium turneri]